MEVSNDNFLVRSDVNPNLLGEGLNGLERSRLLQLPQMALLSLEISRRLNRRTITSKSGCARQGAPKKRPPRPGAEAVLVIYELSSTKTGT